MAVSYYPASGCISGSFAFAILLGECTALTTADLILCFHIVDWYRGEVKVAWWLELITTCFATYHPRIRLLDEWTHTFENPLSPKAALGTLDIWTKENSDNRAMPPRVCLPSDNMPGREIVYPEALHPNLVDYISYDVTDFLQSKGDIALACPADLETNSAALRYILREYGKERVFALRPQVGEVLTISNEITGSSSQSIHLLIVRGTNVRHFSPMIICAAWHG